MYNCIIHIDVFYYVLDVRIFFLVQISIKCILYILLYFFISNKPVFFFFGYFLSLFHMSKWYQANLGYWVYMQPSLLFCLGEVNSHHFVSYFTTFIILSIYFSIHSHHCCYFFFITTKENLILIQFLLYILLQPCLKHLSPPTPFQQQLLSTPKHLYTLKIITFKSPH